MTTENIQSGRSDSNRRRPAWEARDSSLLTPERGGRCSGCRCYYESRNADVIRFRGRWMCFQCARLSGGAAAVEQRKEAFNKLFPGMFPSPIAKAVARG